MCGSNRRSRVRSPRFLPPVLRAFPAGRKCGWGQGEEGGVCFRGLRSRSYAMDGPRGPGSQWRRGRPARTMPRARGPECFTSGDRPADPSTGRDLYNPAKNPTSLAPFTFASDPVPLE